MSGGHCKREGEIVKGQRGYVRKGWRRGNGGGVWQTKVWQKLGMLIKNPKLKLGSARHRPRRKTK